jgi:hypothetical protein
MSSATESNPNDGSAQREAQKDLTARLGAPLVRRAKTTNLKWSTWKWRLGRSKRV